MSDTATTFEPGFQNDPKGLKNVNPESSVYATESAFSPEESITVAKAIKFEIYDSAPAQYNALKILMEKPFLEKNSDEFQYLESGFGRSLLETAGTATLQAASPQTVQTQTITFAAGSLDKMTENIVVCYPNDIDKGTITLISGSSVTIKSVTGKQLPAVASGDKFSILSTIIGDGMDTFENYERKDFITRYNYVQRFLRADRWATWELIKQRNNGTTNYLEINRKHKMDQIRVDLFSAYWNGQKGEYSLKNSGIAKGMGGVYPSMLEAGSATANPTVSGLQAAFETLAFRTNYKQEGATRFVYGTAEMLHNFSKIYKQDGLRYKNEDLNINLNLQMIEFGGMRFVLVPCELFREQSVFPAAWQRRIFVMDQQSISPCIMRGAPAMDIGTTLSKGKNGTREDFEDFYVEAQLSLEFNNPLGSFYLDVA